MDRWCILRCSGRPTLRLAASLAEDGFEVWTPSRTETRRVPRMNARREVTLPILPGFVFASAAHLWTLHDLAEDPKSRIAFSLFRYLDRFPLIADAELQHMRALEQRLARPRKAKRPLDHGALVRVEGGSFHGLSGVVQRSSRGETVVVFDGKWQVKVSTCSLKQMEDRRAA